MNEYENMEEDEGNGIIQTIDQPLEINDYIEIVGICRGEVVLVELLAESIPPDDNTEVLPLQLVILVRGNVTASGRQYQTKEQSSWYVPNGIKEDQNFEICIHVRENEFEIVLNKQRLGFQKHVVHPSTIGAIGMYGDAEFTSVEFKDKNDAYDDSQSEKETEVHPGIVRVQEMRESQQRKKGAPMMVRSSIRRSGSFKAVGNTNVTEVNVHPISTTNIQNETPAANPKRTSSRLSTLGNRKSIALNSNNSETKYAVGGGQSATLAGSAIQGSFHQLDDELMSQGSQHYAGSSTDLPDMDKKQKKRFSILGKNQKSNRSESDIYSIGEDEKKRRSRFGKKQKGSTTHLKDSKTSLPSSSYNSLHARTPSMVSLNNIGTALNEPLSIGPIPKHALKDSAAEIAAYISAQKVVPEFENFSLIDLRDETFMTVKDQLKTSKASLFEDQHGVNQAAPSDESRREVKGTAPEMADILYEQHKATFDSKVSLTGVMIDPRYSVSDAQFSGDKPKDKFIDKSDAVQKPTDIKGPAPEVAARFNDYANFMYQYPPQTNITGITSMSVEYQKPQIDTDFDKVVMQDVDNVHSKRPVETQSLRDHKSDDEGSVNSGSTVYTDNEYYLEVGKSSYFMERKKSLKKYRSRHSVKKDKEARIAMGFDNSSSNSGSSISVLKPDDRKLTPKPKRRQPDYPIDSWLNEDEIRSLSHTAKTYAEPTKEAQRPISLRDEKVGCIELRAKHFQVQFPKPLSQGRRARIIGHFKSESTDVKHCQILLGHNIYVDNIRYDDLIFEISSTGKIALVGLEPHLWTIENTGLMYGKQFENNVKFIMDMCLADTIFQVTLNNCSVLKINKVSVATSITSVQLIKQSSVELDEIVAYIGMVLPLKLIYSNEDDNGVIQRLTIKPKFTAESNCLRLGFSGQRLNAEEECIAIVFDYISSRLKMNSIYLDQNQPPSAELPFVPEQIRKVEIEISPMDNILKVRVNYDVLLAVPLPVELLTDWPKTVNISGDMVLLDAMISPI